MDKAFYVFRGLMSVLGVVLGFYIGTPNPLIYALVAFMVADYITGVFVAIAERSLSSEIGAKGIFKKILILLLVGVANIIDVVVIKEGSTIRSMTIFFYLANEGISILENSVKLGLPVPDVLRNTLEQVRKNNNRYKKQRRRNKDKNAGTPAKQHKEIE